MAITIAIDSILRRRMRAEIRTSAGRTAAIILGVLANIFAVLMAFVVVEGWNDYQSAQADVDREATALATIEENTRTLHREEYPAVRAALDRYVQSVVDDEWKTMAEHGRGSPVTTRALQNLFDEVKALSADGHTQEAFYELTVQALDNVVAARQQRVTASGGSLPLPLYVLLCFGGVVIIGLACALDVEDRRSHVVIVCSIAVVIALMLALVVGFDHPFSGGVSVSDAELKRFLAIPPVP